MCTANDIALPIALLVQRWPLAPVHQDCSFLDIIVRLVRTGDESYPEFVGQVLL